MQAAESEVEATALEVLAEVEGILEPIGLQEEAELPAKILTEYVMDSQKKDRLLCSQLQVVDFLQNFLAQEDTAQGLDPLASEDTSRQKAIAAKEQWKDLKSTYWEHVEAIKSALTQVLMKTEEAQRKQTQLKEVLEQLQAKKQMAMEKLRAAQKKWQLQQEKHQQRLAEVLAEVRERQTGTQQKLEHLHQELGTLKQQAGQEQEKLQRHQIFLRLLYTLQDKAEAELQQELDLPEDKPQHLIQPQKQTEDTMGRDNGVSAKVNERWDRWADRPHLFQAQGERTRELFGQLKRVATRDGAGCFSPGGGHSFEVWAMGTPAGQQLRVGLDASALVGVLSPEARAWQYPGSPQTAVAWDPVRRCSKGGRWELHVVWAPGRRTSAAGGRRGMGDG
ncbi:ZW10 interactor, partial [Carlito syrichta]|uniref:ZW10 interactor n=1 Tax=Carlito syrichta TaxID=1868482 RepID=A0A1U7T813_CARSF